MRTGKIIRWVLILGVAGLATWFILSKANTKTEKKAGPANAGPQQLITDGHIVTTSVIDNSVQSAGTLLSNESVELKPEVSGKVTGIYFQEGSYVQKGTLLVKLYDDDIRAQLSKLEYQKSLAQKTLERQQELLQINGISQQEVDISANQINILNAEIDYNKALLQRTEIRAPFSGTIGIRNISLGAIISPTTVIATLQQNDPLKIDFSVPEKYRSMLGKNDEIQFTVAGDPTTHKGKVYVIDPQIDPATRTIKIRALVNNTSGRLAPGTFAEVKLILKETPNAIMIPSQAVIPGAREKRVVIAKNGRAKFVTVETGIRDASNVQILSGLNPGDTVIISGIMQIKPDMMLNITNLKQSESDNNQ
jgi:membrane fusion protein (multidrug efflux system)